MTVHFLELFEELVSETERDAYFSRADSLREIVGKLKQELDFWRPQKELRGDEVRRLLKKQVGVTYQEDNGFGLAVPSAKLLERLATLKNSKGGKK